MDSIFRIFELPESAVESKVHALNILRALFRNKDLAEEMSNYVEKSVIISVNGFKSTHWNVSEYLLQFYFFFWVFFFFQNFDLTFWIMIAGKEFLDAFV